MWCGAEGAGNCDEQVCHFETEGQQTLAGRIVVS